MVRIQQQAGSEFGLIKLLGRDLDLVKTNPKHWVKYDRYGIQFLILFIFIFL